MALSNWDTFALTFDGEPSDGSFTSEGGITVEFYKNWLYVRDPKAWRKKTGFAKPTVMEVQEGILCYGDVNIAAVRGPKEGIYAVVWSGYEYLAESKVTGMVGIGCYGFQNTLDYILKKHPELRDSLDPKYLDEERYIVGEYSSYGGGALEDWGFDFVRAEGEPEGFRWELNDVEQPDLGDLWVGVTQAEVDFLRNQVAQWLKAYQVPNVLKNLDLRQGQHFNQGDAFFDEAGVAPLEATPVGEVKEPLLARALKYVRMP